MKACALLPMVSLILLWPASPLAQDPVQVDGVHYTPALDNASVRALRAFLPAGAKSPVHQHPDSVVIAYETCGPGSPCLRDHAGPEPAL